MKMLDLAKLKKSKKIFLVLISSILIGSVFVYSCLAESSTWYQGYYTSYKYTNYQSYYLENNNRWQFTEGLPVSVSNGIDSTNIFISSLIRFEWYKILPSEYSGLTYTNITSGVSYTSTIFCLPKYIKFGSDYYHLLSCFPMLSVKLDFDDPHSYIIGTNSVGNVSLPQEGISSCYLCSSDIEHNSQRLDLNFIDSYSYMQSGITDRSYFETPYLSVEYGDYIDLPEVAQEFENYYNYNGEDFDPSIYYYITLVCGSPYYCEKNNFAPGQSTNYNNMIKYLSSYNGDPNHKISYSSPKELFTPLLALNAYNWQFFFLVTDRLNASNNWRDQRYQSLRDYKFRTYGVNDPWGADYQNLWLQDISILCDCSFTSPITTLANSVINKIDYSQYMASLAQTQRDINQGFDLIIGSYDVSQFVGLDGTYRPEYLSSVSFVNSMSDLAAPTSSEFYGVFDVFRFEPGLISKMAIIVVTLAGAGYILFDKVGIK